MRTWAGAAWWLPLSAVIFASHSLGPWPVHPPRHTHVPLLLLVCAVHLPTVVESYKSSDDKHFFKSGSLAGVLRVTGRVDSGAANKPRAPKKAAKVRSQEDDSSDDDGEAGSRQGGGDGGDGDEDGSADLRVEVEPLVRSGRRTNLLPSGLTPPAERIVAKHFRRHRRAMLQGVTVPEVRAAEEQLIALGAGDATSLSMASTHESLVREEDWMADLPDEYELVFENGELVDAPRLDQAKAAAVLAASTKALEPHDPASSSSSSSSSSAAAAGAGAAGRGRVATAATGPAAGAQALPTPSSSSQPTLAGPFGAAASLGAGIVPPAPGSSQAAARHDSEQSGSAKAGSGRVGGVSAAPSAAPQPALAASTAASAAPASSSAATMSADSVAAAAKLDAAEAAKSAIKDELAVVQREQESLKAKAVTMQALYRRQTNPMQKKRLEEQFGKAKRKLAALRDKADALQKQIAAADA